jgi:DNA-binding transcriptional ArsR family regulator
MEEESFAGLADGPCVIDADESAHLVAEALETGAVLSLGVPGVPGLVINGSRPRRRASFGKSFLTVFPEGLAFAVENLTHRELRVFATLALVQGFGEQPIPLRVGDIACRLGLTPAAVSRAISRMRALGILRPGRTIDGQPAGLRLSRRVLFRGNAFHFRELGHDPPLFDPEEDPVIRRMRRFMLHPPARGVLAAARRGSRSASERKSGGGDERGASGSPERADVGPPGAGTASRTRRRSRPASSRPADVPDTGAGGLPSDAASLSA